MTDEPATEIPRQPLFSGMSTILIVAAAGLFLAWLIRGMQIDPPSKSKGQPFPPLIVEGWLNGPGKTAEELAGKVRVFEVWAYWCGPCLAVAPHMIELYDRYQPRGVEFIGLTTEGADQLDRSRQFLKEAKTTWPNAYGAGPTVAPFYQDDSMTIPVMWVVDKQGKVAFHGHPMALPPKLLDELLE